MKPPTLPTSENRNVYHGIESYRRRPMSDSVDSAISKSGMVDNAMEAVGIASPSLCVQKLFPLPVCIAAIDVGRCRTMLDDVGSDTGRTVVVENVEVAFGIESQSLSVQTLFLLPV